MRPTILIHEWVTGGGLAGAALPKSWADEGSAMRRAIARDFAAMHPNSPRVRMTLDHRLPNEAGPWEIVRIGDGEERDKVCALASESDYSLIIAPETEGILQGWAEDLEKIGAKSLGSGFEAVAITGNKFQCAERLRGAGIPTPLARLLRSGSGLPRDLAYPAVLKPIDGAGGIETFLIATPEDQPLPEDRLDKFLIQPYIPGIAMSASFLIDRSGRAWLIAVGMQAIAVREGRFEYQGGTLPVRLASDDAPLRAAISAIPGLRGFVGVDFVLDPPTGAITVIEINPRPTTSCVGLCALLEPGQLARAWLAACDGSATDGMEWLGGLTGTVQKSFENPLTFRSDGTMTAGNQEVRGCQIFETG